MKKRLIVFVGIIAATAIFFSLYKIVIQPLHLVWPQDKERGPDSLMPLVMINTAVAPDSELRFVRIL